MVLKGFAKDAISGLDKNTQKPHDGSAANAIIRDDLKNDDEKMMEKRRRERELREKEVDLVADFEKSKYKDEDRDLVAEFERERAKKFEKEMQKDSVKGMERERRFEKLAPRLEEKKIEVPKGAEMKHISSSKSHLIKWFSELSKDDISIAGGKGANLGEMYNHKFPVPPGFVITAQSFDYFIKQNSVKERIKNIIESIDLENTFELDKGSREIRNLIESQELPKDLREEILEAYSILSTEKINKVGISKYALDVLKNAKDPVFVSVRSSATTEDLAEASFAGQQESFLNIKGDHPLIENIKKCFSSLYTPRAIYYRNRKGFNEGAALLAVVIQKMVDSAKSGVAFSRDPMLGSDNIVVEAVFGLGEGIVSGQIAPDHYEITRDLKINKIKIGTKKTAIVRNSSGRNENIKLSSDKSMQQVLSNGQILEVANISLKLEAHYKKPQDIEFAVEDERVYVVQSRPITTLNNKVEKTEISARPILEGLGASPGIGIGYVKIIKTMEDLVKIRKGDVLVTKMTDPDMVVSMQKSVAIVTDEGGLTAHAAIVSREMGIPAIVGTGNATSILKDGMKITVDGSSGRVYEGEVAESKKIEIKQVVPTQKIKLKLIVDIPEFAERAAGTGIDAVGLLRLEGIIASSGKHPLAHEKENTLHEYTELLRAGVEKIASHFMSVWIRTSDIRSDEYSALRGSPPREINPMLGLHGIRFSLLHPKIFEAELSAIKKVAEKYPNRKFGVMFPQIISIEEVLKAKEHFNKYKTDNMIFGVMIETPAAVQIIEDICKEVKFISFGTNDLTQFTLAIDRGEESLQHLYNEFHPAVLSEIKKVISVCKRYNVETSICGQAGSKKEMIEILFREGINSISLNADVARDASLLVQELEKRVAIKPIVNENVVKINPVHHQQVQVHHNQHQNQNQNKPTNIFEREFNNKHKHTELHAKVQKMRGVLPDIPINPNPVTASEINERVEELEEENSKIDDMNRIDIDVSRVESMAHEQTKRELERQRKNAESVKSSQELLDAAETEEYRFEEES